MPIVLENYAHSFRLTKPSVLVNYNYYLGGKGNIFYNVMFIT